MQGHALQASISPATAIRKLTIATRESALAMWQAHFIKDQLENLYPGLEVELLGMTTTGDQLLATTLSKIGGKGLFVKELELALEAGRADIAVHSMKDVPVLLPPQFCIAAITRRADPRDAFVSNQYATLAELPPGAVVGTSSLRRQSQLMARYPHLVIEPLRGNVQTRLRKLDEGQYSAIILAAAGLKRLGLEARIRALLAPDDSIPAVGQGALGIECLASRQDIIQLLQALQDAETAACVLAERAMSRALNGSCQTPLGAYAQLNGDQLHLRGFVASPDGRTLIEDQVAGDASHPEPLGLDLAQRLLAAGAGVLLAEIPGNRPGDSFKP